MRKPYNQAMADTLYLYSIYWAFGRDSKRAYKAEEDIKGWDINLSVSEKEGIRRLRDLLDMFLAAEEHRYHKFHDSVEQIAKKDGGQ